jgi:hypothetical protein
MASDVVITLFMHSDVIWQCKPLRIGCRDRRDIMWLSHRSKSVRICILEILVCFKKDPF